MVSVIIPTYNRAEKVVQAVESVFSQTFAEFELIVVDDGSTDDTESKLRPYFSRIQYCRQANLGVSSARNHGIRLARFNYLAFLDSDDLWLPDKLKVQVAYMEANPDAKICQTDEIWIRNGKRVNPMNKHKKYSGYIFPHCLPLCIVSPSAVMIKKDYLEQAGLFDETFTVCEDYELWLRISRETPVYLIEQPLIIKHGGHDDQLSRKYWGMDRFRVQAMEKLLNSNSLTSEQRRQVIEELNKKCDILITGFHKRNRTTKLKTIKR